MKTSYTLSAQDNGNIIYMDINVQNSSPTRQPASFVINRTSPLLDYPNSEYFASIIRFTVPITSQPLFLFFTQSNIVSMKFNGVTVHSELVFQRTEFNTDQVFQNPSSITGTLVGAVYQYQTLADMMNVALADCCNQLSITGQIPYMTYDTVTSRFTVFSPITWVDTYPYTDTTKPKIFLNKLLQTYFVNFNNITYNNQANNNDCDYQIITANNYNNLYEDSNSNKWYMNTQEWNGVQYTNSLSNISIVSNALPYTGDSLNNILLFQNVAQSGSIKSISDFEIEKSEPGSQRALVQYQSQNNRYLDLTGNNRLTSLDMSFFCFYEELVNNGQISPYQQLIMNPFEVITVKLMFKKKSLNY